MNNYNNKNIYCCFWCEYLFIYLPKAFYLQNLPPFSLKQKGWLWKTLRWKTLIGRCLIELICQALSNFVTVSHSLWLINTPNKSTTVYSKVLPCLNESNVFDFCVWFLKSRVNAAFVAVFFDKFWHKSLKAEVSQVNKCMLSRKQKFDLWPRLVLAAARLTYQLIECSEFTRQSTEQNRNLRKPRKLLSDSRVELSCPTLTFFFVKCINYYYEPCFNTAVGGHPVCVCLSNNKLTAVGRWPTDMSISRLSCRVWGRSIVTTWGAEMLRFLWRRALLIVALSFLQRLWRIKHMGVAMEMTCFVY